MAKMIVNAPNGEQQLIDIEVGGSYFDESLVVWDERKDGKLPDDIVIGSMAKEGNDLIVLPEPIFEAPKEPDPVEIKTLTQLVALLKEKGVI